MKKTQGFTLVELMITLAISVSLFLWANSFSSVFGRVETAERINRDASIILESMEQYYSRHCRNAVFPSVSIATLQTEGILVGSGVFNNPWGNDFQLSIVGIGTPNPRMRVSAVFTSVDDANYVAGFSENATASGGTVIWVMSGSLNRTVDGVNKQLDREIFGSPLC